MRFEPFCPPWKEWVSSGDLLPASYINKHAKAKKHASPNGIDIAIVVMISHFSQTSNYRETNHGS
jgi:hypothetical protein